MRDRLVIGSNHPRKYEVEALGQSLGGEDRLLRKYLCHGLCQRQSVCGNLYFIVLVEERMKITQWTLALSMLLGYVVFTMPWVVVRVQVGQDQQAQKYSYSYLIDDAPIVSGCKIFPSNWNSEEALSIYLKSVWVGRVMICFQFFLWLCCLIVYRESEIGFSRLMFVLISAGLFCVAGFIMIYASPHLSCHGDVSAIAQDSVPFFPSVVMSFTSIGLGFFVLKRFLKYAIDKNINLADLPKTMKYPDGEFVTTTYDNNMSPKTTIGNAIYVSNTNYDSAGRMTSRALGNGLTQTYDYYDWNQQGGRLETLVTGSLQNLAYVYDPVGNISQIANSAAGETSVYEYDDLDRLTSWQLNQDTPETYEYDEDTGNLTDKNELALDYPDASGSDPTHPHAVTSANASVYAYRCQRQPNHAHLRQ